jgi:hypothetical protein
MNLKTEDGKQVFLNGLMEMHVLDGTTLKKIDRAVTCVGVRPFFTEDEIAQYLAPVLSKYDLVEKVSELESNLVSDSRGYSGYNQVYSRVVTAHTLGGVKIEWNDYETIRMKISELDEFCLKRKKICVGNTSIPVDGVLSMIGAGNFVTHNSLRLGCKEGDSKIRFAVGDRVEYEIAGKTYYGAITALLEKARIARMDGVINNKDYSVIRKTTSEIFSEQGLLKLHPSIEENFKEAFDRNKDRIYRAEVMYERFVMPLFPQQGCKSQIYENAQTCTCPLCGYRMGEINDSGMFICNFCTEEGQVLDSTEGTVTLLLRALPSKNKVAMSEARCCINCMNDPFSGGRFDSQLSGFCQVAQKGVELCSVCNFWFPRNSKDYLLGLKARVRAMKGCVGLEYSRGLETFAYTEEEHVALTKECKELGVFYENAHQKLSADLRAEGMKSLRLNGQQGKEEFEDWKKRLSVEISEDRKNVPEVHIEVENP